MKKVFTTGQIAKMCSVAARTVSKWFDSGRLKGYRIPGSSDRRVPRADLIEFIKASNMPMPDELNDEVVVLLIGVQQSVKDVLNAVMRPDIVMLEANCPFQAGMLFKERHPKVVVLDVTVGSGTIRSIVEKIGDSARVIVLAGEDGTALDVPVSTVLRHPLHPQALVEAIEAA